MTRYHLSDDGTPRPCNAAVGSCPLGDGTPHGDFTNEGEAMAFAEQVNALRYGQAALSSVSAASAISPQAIRDIVERHIEEHCIAPGELTEVWQSVHSGGVSLFTLARFKEKGLADAYETFRNTVAAEPNPVAIREHLKRLEFNPIAITLFMNGASQEELEEARDSMAEDTLYLANAANTDAKLKDLLARDGLSQESWAAAHEEIALSQMMDQAEEGPVAEALRRAGYRGSILTS